MRIPPDRSATGSALPRSVILFAPSMTEAACALGYEELVVAITDYDRWPVSVLDRPRVGGALDPDFERIAVLDPDLLVLQGENEELRRFAAARGMRIADVKMDDELESILDGMLRLDDLLGGADSRRGEALVSRIRDGLDSLAASRSGPAPAVLLVLSRNPHEPGGVFTAGAGTFLDGLLTIAGATNWAAAHGPGYFEVPLDLIAAAGPDLILEYGDAVGGDLAERNRVWSMLPGSAPTIGVVQFDGLMIPGPRLVESATALANALDRAVDP